MSPRSFFVALILLLPCAVIASLCIGSVVLSPDEIATILSGQGHSDSAVLVTQMRLPRAAGAVLAGASLAAGGALAQSVTGNRLADPGLLGVTAGATLAVVLAIRLASVIDPTILVWFAMVGGGVAGLVAVALAATGSPRGFAQRLVVCGVVVSGMVAALTAAVLAIDKVTMRQLRFWTAGSVAAVSPSVVVAILPYAVVGLTMAIALGRALDITLLGTDVASSLGQRVRRVQVLTGLAIVLLGGTAAAAVGPIAFIGLAAPNVVRILPVKGVAPLVVLSAMLGGILLVAADTIGRFVLRPGELEAGVVTGLVGGPLFVLLVYRRVDRD